jgi:hypothetical protein
VTTVPRDGRGSRMDKITRWLRAMAAMLTMRRLDMAALQTEADES